MLLIIESEDINHKMSIVEVPNTESLQNEALDINTMVKDDINDTEVMTNNRAEIVNIVQETVAKVSIEIKNDEIATDNFYVEKPKSQSDKTDNTDKNEDTHHELQEGAQFECPKVTIYLPINNENTENNTSVENNGSACTKEIESTPVSSITTSNHMEGSDHNCNAVIVPQNPEETKNKQPDDFYDINNIHGPAEDVNNTSNTTYLSATAEVLCNGSVSNQSSDNVTKQHPLNGITVVNIDEKNNLMDKLDRPMEIDDAVEMNDNKEDNNEISVTMNVDDAETKTTFMTNMNTIEYNTDILNETSDTSEFVCKPIDSTHLKDDEDDNIESEIAKTQKPALKSPDNNITENDQNKSITIKDDEKSTEVDDLVNEKDYDNVSIVEQAIKENNAKEVIFDKLLKDSVTLEKDATKQEVSAKKISILDNTLDEQKLTALRDDKKSTEVNSNIASDKDNENYVSIVEEKISEKNDKEVIFDKLLKDCVTLEKDTTKQKVSVVPVKKISMLANNLEIFSDEEDEPTPIDINPLEKDKVYQAKRQQRKDCVSLVDDDDDIMVIDDDNSKSEKIHDEIKSTHINSATSEVSETDNASISINTTDTPDKGADMNNSVNYIESTESILKENESEDKPLIAKNFLKNFKSKMSEMTRADLEEFCLIKIVEGVIDRSNLSEIKAKLKTMTQNVEEWRKKSMVLNKQNRDLQIVLRTVQEEQKKKSDEAITPLKITRSVGMQVLMGENRNENPLRPRNPKRFISTSQAIKNTPQKQQIKSLKTPIPIPRLVPASPTKPASGTVTSQQLQNSTITSNSGPTKTSLSPNTTKSFTPPVKKAAEKRPLSDSIDLTDDEPTPPAKKPPVRLVPSQQLMAPGRSSIVNNGKTPPSPRQVYIPIGSQNVNIRPQPVMYKPPGSQGVRTRGPNPGTIIRTNSTPIIRTTLQRNPNKHPAPLPQAFSQPQPPNWKALPPAPDLKISKIENGIVVSWKIDGYQESSYEEIVSYQLYAYQETSAPASTLLWNKIGDIKALPLPMACTLTQFIAGYKYYFAVRAVDIRSRIGPFSLPGSILLLNK